MDKIRRVLIVGGGIGGLSLAIRLIGIGCEVDLVEIDSDWRALGAGLTLNGPTLRALEKIGVLEEVRRVGHLHGGRRVHDRFGKVIFDQPAYVPGPDDLRAGGGILRPVLHEILRQRVLAEEISVQLGISVESIVQNDENVGVALTNGRTGEYDLVVGADGLRSRIRSMIWGDAVTPAFTGQGCWRAVFERPVEVETGWFYIDDRHKCGFNPVSLEEMYMFLLEPATDNPWRDEAQWQDLLEEKMSQFGGMPNALRTSLGPSSKINYRPLEALLVPPPWHRGRVVLLGDSAHATTPHAGYGAGLAMEDAVVLSEILRSSDSIEINLSRYSASRYDRCRDVVEQSLRIGDLEIAGASAQQQRDAATALIELVVSGSL